MTTGPSRPARADLGIVGGGQLARMTIERALKLNLTTIVLDPEADCPAANLAHGFIQAGFDDADGLQALVESCEVTTFDVESPDAGLLQHLARQGHRILPEPAVLATIQDKLLQRQFFASRGFCVPDFVEADAPSATDVQRLGFPVVQKSRRGGYDGRGVVVMRDASDLTNILPVPSILEKCVEIKAEISVIVARGPHGDVRCYPAVEMIFDPLLNLVDGLIFPARIEPRIADRARRLATRAVEALKGVGIFAVELFLGPGDELWLNEVAPRPHNSGHVTIEGAVTCQFEQHLRAVLGLPLGDCSSVRPAAMVNLTGPVGSEGPVAFPGLAAALRVPGARVHLYGKRWVRPGRKMGHITVLDEDPVAALERARQARRLLALGAEKEAA